MAFYIPSQVDVCRETFTVKIKWVSITNNPAPYINAAADTPNRTASALAWRALIWRLPLRRQSGSASFFLP
jgi:hypothetical protein